MAVGGAVGGAVGVILRWRVRDICCREGKVEGVMMGVVEVEGEVEGVKLLKFPAMR